MRFMELASQDHGLREVLGQGAERLPCPPMWPNPYKGWVLACLFDLPTRQALCIITSVKDLRDAKYEPCDKVWLRLPLSVCTKRMPWLELGPDAGAQASL